DTVLRLVRQVAAGLDAAHAGRLVHGALESPCILVGDGGATMLVGIGILGAVEEAGLIDAMWEHRDPELIAPEQQHGPRAVAPADGVALAVGGATLVRPGAAGS